jgi:hypothetical protein
VTTSNQATKELRKIMINETNDDKAWAFRFELKDLIGKYKPILSEDVISKISIWELFHLTFKVREEIYD